MSEQSKDPRGKQVDLVTANRQARARRRFVQNSPDALADRERRLIQAEQGLGAAKAAAQEEANAILADARLEAGKIVQEAREQARALRQEANEQAQRLLTDAQAGGQSEPQPEPSEPGGPEDEPQPEPGS